MAPIPWSYYATPLELGFRPWALDFAPDNYGGGAFPGLGDDRFIFDPINNGLEWQPEDWDPALRLWTLPWDPNLTVWLQGEDISRASIMAAREFAGEHAKWRFPSQATLITRGWLTTAAHLRWQNEFAVITAEINELFDLMEDDRDRFLAEANAQADGLANYFIAFLGMDAERRPWTVELIRCGLAIGNLAYMHYKALFRRVRPSTICPGLVPPFGPPRHPSFPSGHAFLGHIIALLLLEIPQIRDRLGEAPANPPPRELVQPTLAEVMSATHVFKGPLMWLAERLGKNRERIGVHYRSDSLAGRWIAGAIWALLTRDSGGAATPPGVGGVPDSQLIRCPSLRRVLRLAKAEWQT